MFDVVVDLVRVAHLLAFAVGIGAAVLLETVFSRRALVLVGDDDLELVEKGHRLITFALVGLWLSGLALLAIRTGFQWDAMSPKLLTKLAVILVLTANAMIITRYALPILRRCEGRSIRQLRTKRLVGLGATAGLSAASWTAGLMLGAIGAFKPMEALPLALIFGGILIAGAVCGAGVAAMLGHRYKTGKSRRSVKLDDDVVNREAGARRGVDGLHDRTLLSA